MFSKYFKHICFESKHDLQNKLTVNNFIIIIIGKFLYYVGIVIAENLKAAIW